MAVTKIDSFEPSSGDSVFYWSWGAHPGQCFTSQYATLDSVKVKLDNWTNTTGTVYITIKKISGTYGSSGVPTGAVLATSDSINMSALPNHDPPVPDWVTFNFTGAERITLDGGYYALIINSM